MCGCRFSSSFAPPSIPHRTDVVDGTPVPNEGDPGGPHHHPEGLAAGAEAMERVAWHCPRPSPAYASGRLAAVLAEQDVDVGQGAGDLRERLHLAAVAAFRDGPDDAGVAADLPRLAQLVIVRPAAADHLPGVQLGPQARHLEGDPEQVVTQ